VFATCGRILSCTTDFVLSSHLSRNVLQITFAQGIAILCGMKKANGVWLRLPATNELAMTSENASSEKIPSGVGADRLQELVVRRQKCPIAMEP